MPRHCRSLFVILFVMLGAGSIALAQSPDGEGMGKAAERIASEGWTPAAIGQLVGSLFGWGGMLLLAWMAYRFRAQRNTVVDGVESIPDHRARQHAKKTVATIAVARGHEDALNAVVRARQSDQDLAAQRRKTMRLNKGPLAVLLVVMCFGLEACAMSHPTPALTNLINGQTAALEQDVDDAMHFNRIQLLELLSEHVLTFYVLRYGYLGTAVPPELAEVLAPRIAVFDEGK